MSTGATAYDDLDGRSAGGRDGQPDERFEDETIMHLERDQFVAETSRPVARAPSARVPPPHCGRCGCSPWWSA